jgi:adenylate cyclase
VELNPNNALNLAHAGWVRGYMGQPREGIEALHRSIRLSPRDPLLFRTYSALAYAHILLGEFDAAAGAARKAIEINPNYTVSYRAGASALAHLGRLDEARDLVARLSALVPDLSLRNLAEVTVYRHSGGLDLILDGLRKAGVPE